MEKEIRSNLNNYHSLIIGFLILSFFFDFIDKIDYFYTINLIKFNRYLKLILIISVLVFIVFRLKYIFTNLNIFLLVFASLLVTFLLKNNYSTLYLDEFLRYCFGLLVYPLFYYTYFKTHIPLAQHLYLFFKFFVCLNLIVIFVGLTFDLSVVQTYQFGRFGYNGMLLSQGVTPYVYLAATVLFLNFKDKRMLALVILLSIISGIKAVYLAEFLLLIFFVLFNKSYSNRKKIIISSATLSGFLLVIIILFLSKTFKDVFNSDGFFSMIFSYRNENLMLVFDLLNELNYNIFVGVISMQIVRIEMQFFDILLFFGIIGLVVYTLFIRHLILHIALTTISRIYLIIAVTLSLLSGNLLYIPMAMFLLFLVLFSFKNTIVNNKV